MLEARLSLDVKSKRKRTLLITSLQQVIHRKVIAIEKGEKSLNLEHRFERISMILQKF